MTKVVDISTSDLRPARPVGVDQNGRTVPGHVLGDRGDPFDPCEYINTGLKSDERYVASQLRVWRMQHKDAGHRWNGGGTTDSYTVLDFNAHTLVLRGWPSKEEILQDYMQLLAESALAEA